MVRVFRRKETPRKKPEPEQFSRKHMVYFTNAYSPYEEGFEAETLPRFEAQYLTTIMSKSLDWRTVEQYSNSLLTIAGVFKGLIKAGTFGTTLQVVPLSLITMKNVRCNEDKILLVEGVLPRDMLFAVTGVASWNEIPEVIGLSVYIGQKHLPFVPLSELNHFKEMITSTGRVIREYPLVQETPLIAVLPGVYYRIDLLTRGDCEARMALLGWAFAFSRDVPTRVINCISGGTCDAAEKEATD